MLKRTYLLLNVYIKNYVEFKALVWFCKQKYKEVVFAVPIENYMNSSDPANRLSSMYYEVAQENQAIYLSGPFIDMDELMLFRHDESTEVLDAASAIRQINN